MVNTLFIKEGLIDEIHVTLVPRLFGRGLSLFHESLDIDLELLENKPMDHGSVLLIYRVKK
jgi:dihydrofolate reductase